MTAVEFRRYVFRTPDQWRHGVGFRLQSLARGGFQLFLTPAFQAWVTQADEARLVSSLDVDACGRVLWLHRRDGHLYRRDPSSGIVERLIPLAVSSGATPPGVGRMLRANGRIWIHDRGNSRILSLRADTFQILAEIPLPAGIDVALGGGRLFAIDAEAIRSFDGETGQPLGAFPIPRVTSAVALGADPQGRWIYVVDACTRGFLRFAIDGRFHGELGQFDDVAPTFTPHLLCVDAEGNLFVSDGGGSVHEFAPDGGYIGHTGLLGPVTTILAVTCGADGFLYATDPAGIARFGREGGVAGNEGHFYSGTLDNGTDGRHTWHRLDVVADIADGGAVDVYYATSNESSLADQITAIVAERSGAAEKAAALEQALRDRWRGPQQLRAPLPASASPEAPADALVTQPTHSLLFDQDSGRYLWLKIAMSGLAPRATAVVRELRVYYPRLSYLRYLPAVYQEDKPSREFLERFLSLFETVLSGLEATVEKVPETFSPERTPSEFLEWLGQWLDIALEEDWSAGVKRRLIGEAARLYERKGTPAGLADFIEIVTGRRPLIRESFATERPSVLGADLRLGANSRLMAQPVEDRPPTQQTRLGRSSILGTSHIRADATLPRNAFRATAHAFTVVLNLSPQQFRRHARGLHRVIREQSPAHAAYHLRVAAGAGLGSETVVGISCDVENPQPLHLGYSALGRSMCRRNVSYGPELGVDATLVGRADGPGSESLPCCGE
jgi:phage tail-like protein